MLRFDFLFNPLILPEGKSRENLNLDAMQALQENFDFLGSQ